VIVFTRTVFCRAHRVSSLMRLEWTTRTWCSRGCSNIGGLGVNCWSLCCSNDSSPTIMWKNMKPRRRLMPMTGVSSHGVCLAPLSTHPPTSPFHMRAMDKPIEPSAVRTLVAPFSRRNGPVLIRSRVSLLWCSGRSRSKIGWVTRRRVLSMTSGTSRMCSPRRTRR
jgi:hypothetical protein